MATYKTVNADQLDADMTALANTIRTKGGTSGKLAWPEGYKSAVLAIETGGGDEILDKLTDGSITEYENERVTNVKGRLFYEDTNIVSVSFPNAKTTGWQVFYYSSSLREANFPKLSSLSNSMFRSCTALQELVLPKVTTTYAYACDGCTSLKKVDFGAISTINLQTFKGCSALTELIIRKASSVCSLGNVSALTGTPIESGTGYIYVPSALLSDTDETKDYRRATNWSAYAAQFRNLEDYTVDGTTTGELDPAKTGT